MAGCQALFGGSRTTSGSVAAVSTNLDFGTAVVGGSKQLTNHSSAIAMIASAVSSDPAFQVTEPAMPFALAPGQRAVPLFQVKLCADLQRRWGRQRYHRVNGCAFSPRGENRYSTWVYDKLGVSNRVEPVLYALTHRGAEDASRPPPPSG
jgi:hypothetical protein